MGWQEDCENDEAFAPLTEEEVREFQVVLEKVTFMLMFIMSL